MLKKTLVSFVAIAFVISGFASAALPAHAASIGDVIMCPGFTPAYYWAEDGNRYVFPSAKNYHSWYVDFTRLSNISCDDLSEITLGGMVDYQPGTRLLKIQTVPTVYFVSPFGELRAIADEDMAHNLFGPSWNYEINDVPDVFFMQYTIGDDIADGELPAGMILENDDGDFFRVDYDGELLEITDLLDENQLELFGNRGEDYEDVADRMGLTFSPTDYEDLSNDQIDEQMLWLEVVPIADEDEVDESEIEVVIEEVDESTMPDFTVDSIALTSSNGIQAVVSNVGAANADTDEFGVYFWFDGDLEWTYSVSTLADKGVMNVGDSSAVTPQTLNADTTVKVCVDPTGEIDESDETNNCMTVDVEVEEEDGEPETNLTAAHPLLSSSNALLFYVQNTGDTDIESFDTYIYIDGVLEWTYSSTTLSDQDALTSGGITTISPQILTESADVEVCVDPNDEIDESDETDNCSSASYTIETDLSVTSLALTGSSENTLTATIENLGTEDVSSFSVYFWFDDVLSWTYSSTTLNDKDALTSGGVTTVTPQTLTENSTVEVCVDPNDNIDEVDEANNCVTEEFVVEEYTDLEMSDIYLSSSGVLVVEVENTGTESLSSSAQFSTYIYLDGVLSRTYSNTTLNDQDWNEPGGVTTISPYALSADTEVQACVDMQDTIDEEDETNNCMTVDLEV
jgi:subtilase family serine protease